MILSVEPKTTNAFSIVGALFGLIMGFYLYFTRSPGAPSFGGVFSPSCPASKVKQMNQSCWARSVGPETSYKRGEISPRIVVFHPRQTHLISAIYSRANAPTGSAGEESVSWCWVVVVVVVAAAVARCFVDTHARRARARAKHAPKNGLIWRARASPHICGKEVREPTN